MKKIQILLISLVTFCIVSGCQKLKMPDSTYYPPVTEAQAPSKYVPYETIQVNVPEGCKSIVYLGSTKIATCYTSGSVMVPKAAITKANNELSIINVAGASKGSVASENTLEMVVAFEDTKDGDHDYNDLVLQAMVSIENKTDGTNSTTLDITPIALGSSKALGLGVVLTDNEGKVISDEVVAEDCRSFFFGSDEGFINTNPNTRKHYPIKSVKLGSSTSNGSASGISWYLITDGQRLYAATSFQACLDNSDKPQGLVLVNIRQDKYYVEEGGAKYFCGNDFWNYPREAVDIKNVYPGFESAFLNNGNFSVLAEPERDFYEAIAADENNKITADCLYTVYKHGGEEGEKPSTETVILWDGGPQWATYNVGATSPEEFGLFFSWGNLDGYPCDGPICDHFFPYRSTDPGYYFAETTGGGSLTTSIAKGDKQYDAAAYLWGGNWRMPTDEEYFQLVNQDFRAGEVKTKYEWVENYNNTGVSGGLFTSLQDDTRSIFIPAAGDIKGSTHEMGTGYAWTSTMVSDKQNARVVQFGPTKAEGKGLTRSIAVPIRPVCD